MAEMLDCLVSYCSVSAHPDGMPLQYLCFHVRGSPGPTPAGGVAVITVVAAKNPIDREIYHAFHAVRAGGPRAALEAALDYLDKVHGAPQLAKVQTEIRSVPCVEATNHESAPFLQWTPSAIGSAEPRNEAIKVLDTRARYRAMPP
jgi:hypothetical protein